MPLCFSSIGAKAFTNKISTAKSLAQGAVSATGGAVGYYVGGAYAASIARGTASYLIKPAVSTSIFNLPETIAFNIARKASIEALGAAAYGYGAYAGGVVGLAAAAAGSHLINKATGIVYDAASRNYNNCKNAHQHYPSNLENEGLVDDFYLLEEDALHLTQRIGDINSYAPVPVLAAI